MYRLTPKSIREEFSDWGGKLILAFAGLLLFHLAYVTFHFGGPEWASLISNLVSPTICAGASILTWRASSNPSLTSRRRIAWRSFSFAYLFFMLGDLAWLILENGLGLQPFPSVADLGYLLFYPLMFAGLICSVEKFRSREEMINFWLDASVVMLAGGMVIWRLLVEPIVAAGEAGELKTFLSAAYPIGDVVLLLGISSLLLRRSGSESQMPTNLILVGVVINFAADLIFGFQNLHGAYKAGAPVDALFTLACFPIMLGAHLAKRRDADPIHEWKTSGNFERFFWLPYIAVAIVYAVLLQMVIERAEPEMEKMFVLAGVVTLLVVLRQITFVREVIVANAAVSSLQLRIQGIFSASSDAIGLAKLDGTLTEVNVSFLDLTGYELGEVVGKMKYTDLFPDDFLDITVEPVRGDERERELIRKDGSVRPVAAKVYAVDGGEKAATALAVVFRDLTARKELQQEMSYRARHDSLTGLANRSMLHERVAAALSRARRRSTRVALLFVDLDNFKTVNDTLGHAAGDELLTEVSERLRSCLRASDTAARLGGDEFAVLLEDLASDSEPQCVADRLIAAIRKPVIIAGKDVFVGASVGIATGDLALTPDDLLRNADVAMYAAKRQGKDRFAAFEPRMQEAILGRAKLEADLREAVEKREFQVKYQPVIDLGSGLPIGVEALIRWHHPDGDIGPDVFVPIAEEINLISEIDNFVLETACQDIADLNSDIRLAGRLSLNVNVSSREFSDEGYLQRVARACQRADLPMTELILEITESAMLSNQDSTIDTLENLRSMGVRIAVDDFGTGYSSLSYLHRFPVDILKIDRSFIEKVSDRDAGAAMVRAILLMGRSLSLTTIAEGIEESEQLDVLGSMNCEQGQGYLFAKPLSIQELESYLHRHLALTEKYDSALPIETDLSDRFAQAF